MDVRRLFGEFTLRRFIEEHLHRLPLALPNVCPDVQSLGTWQTLAAILAADNADVMIVRQGARCDAARPTDLLSAQSLGDGGCTILVRHAERHHAEISKLANAFRDTFHAPVDVHVYATPPGSFGFSWHYDAEDVFILQTTGEKEYLLRKNTVNPWPLEETIPVDMKYERESMPLMRVLLNAGDLLYIPCGYWHRARATESSETAISLAVGVMSRSAIEVVDLLRGEVLQSLLWRQRLPIENATEGDTNDNDDAIKLILDQLAADAARTIKSPSFLERVKAHFRLNTTQENGAP